MSLELVFGLFLLPLAGLIVGLRRVPEGSVYTLHRFGRFVRALPPGWHVSWPIVDQVAHEVSLVGHHIELRLQSEAAKAEVYFQILDPEQAGAALDEVDELVLRLARDRLSSISEVAVEPRLRAMRLKDELNQRLRAQGVHVTRCQLA